MAQQPEGNAFTFDEDEDMDFLLEQAANAGTAATDEDHGGSDSEADALFGGNTSRPVTAPTPTPQAIPEEPQALREEPLLEDSSDDFDFNELFEAPTQSDPAEDLQRQMEALNQESQRILSEEPEPVAQVQPEPVVAPVAAPAPRPEPTYAPEPVRQEAPAPAPAPVATPVTAPVQTPAPVAEPVREPVHSRIVRQTEDEQLERAKAIIAAVDEFRKLKPAARDVVAQLISQEQEFTVDEATIAVRAINTDELTFATMASLKEAKAQDPVDRAFYILGLSDEVRKSLGSLVSAFSGDEFPQQDVLVFSRALVGGIEKLDAEAIEFVNSTEAVLRAAKQR